MVEFNRIQGYPILWRPPDMEVAGSYPGVGINVVSFINDNNLCLLFQRLFSFMYDLMHLTIPFDLYTTYMP